jgi:glycosyltransferase involved in cell wall biosynthesis
MSAPLASILVPCYNSARFISATIESALGQTYAPVEVIVVDDGSTDSSTDLIEKYEPRGVKLIRQPNAGAGAARNRAFAASRGEYVLFLDADDVVCDTHIEALVLANGNNPRAISFGQWDRFYSEIAEAKFPVRPTNVCTTGPQWILLDWNHVNMTQCGMFLIPRRFVEEFGGWEPSLSAGPIDDFEFFARIISNCDRMTFTEGAKLYYRSGLPSSLSRRKRRDAVEAKLKSIELGTSHFLERFDTPEARLTVANKFQAFVYEHYPEHNDLLSIAKARVSELGGADIEPSGPPGFEKLRPWIGWRGARRVERLAYRWGLNGASRARRSTSKSL